MDDERATSQVSWGARVNARFSCDRGDCPGWFKPLDREKWAKEGLVVWHRESQHVVHLSATSAVHLLDELRSDEAWMAQGIVIGEPATRLVPGEPEREPGSALLYPIELSPSQTKLPST